MHQVDAVDGDVLLEVIHEMFRVWLIEHVFNLSVATDAPVKSFAPGEPVGRTVDDRSCSTTGVGAGVPQRANLERPRSSFV